MRNANITLIQEGEAELAAEVARLFDRFLGLSDRYLTLPPGDVGDATRTSASSTRSSNRSRTAPTTSCGSTRRTWRTWTPAPAPPLRSRSG